MATRNDNNKIIIETALNVKNMGERLFGGPGQPDGGALHFIMNQHKALADKLESNKQELLDQLENRRIEINGAISTVAKDAETAVAKVATDQEELETKVNRVITAGVTVNAIAGLFLTWLGVRHHG